MPEAVASSIDAMPPEVQIVQMLEAQVVSRLVYAAAALNLADHLAEGPKTAEQIAPLAGAHAGVLHRVMRTLASLGLFAEDRQHRFTLLPLGATLKSGTPSHATALLFGDPFWHSLGQVLYSIRTGKTGFEEAFGKPLFEWLGHHPAEAELFNRTMVGFHGTEPPAIAAAHDFSVYHTIADVGGSTGNLLTTILTRHPGPRGILFDLPHVVSGAPALIAQRGLTERVTIEAGSLFETVPPGADAYIFSHIIHDWDERKCVAILENCRRAMKPTSRLLIVETVLPEGDAPHPGKILDMLMLVVPGGQERTASEYSGLLEAAGFKMTRIVATASPVSIVEAELR